MFLGKMGAPVCHRLQHRTHGLAMIADAAVCESMGKNMSEARDAHTERLPEGVSFHLPAAVGVIATGVDKVAGICDGLTESIGLEA